MIAKITFDSLAGMGEESDIVSPDDCVVEKSKSREDPG